MLVHLAGYIESVAQNFIALELWLGPVRRELLDLKRIPIPEVIAEPIHRLAEYALSLALRHFERANLVDQVIKYVTQVHGVQHAKSKIDCELQPRLARGCLNSIAVLEQQHAEAIEAGILQRET